MKIKFTSRLNWNKLMRLIYPDTYDKAWLDDLYSLALTEVGAKLLETADVNELSVKSIVSFSTEKSVIVPTGLHVGNAQIQLESLIEGCSVSRYPLGGFEGELILLVKSNTDDKIFCINEFDVICKIKEA